MAKRQTRRTISMNRHLFDHAKRWAAERDISQTFACEQAIAAHTGFDLESVDRVIIPPRSRETAVAIRMIDTGLFDPDHISKATGIRYDSVLRYAKLRGVKLPRKKRVA